MGKQTTPCLLQSTSCKNSAFNGVVFIKTRMRESHDTWVVHDWGDFLESREESLLLYTIQSERLTTLFPLFTRLPSIETAINI